MDVEARCADGMALAHWAAVAPLGHRTLIREVVMRWIHVAQDRPFDVAPMRTFKYDGKHYHIEEMAFLPPPVQSPRIPVWVVGAWPRMKSMERVLRWDGLLPNKINEDGSHGDVMPCSAREFAAGAEVFFRHEQGE